MKLNFLGKGSAFYPLYGNTGAYIKNGDELYLLDCGETAFDTLYRREDLDSISQVYVILTHLHADHVGSLGTLISYYYCIHGMKVHVIHPEATVKQLLTLEGIDPNGYVYLERLPENKAGLRAEPIPVKHALDMKCYGYLLSDGEECIYYIGDASDVPDEIRAGFLEGAIQKIYQDTSTHDSPVPSHCFYGKLEQWIPREKRKSVYCMHLDSACEELLTEKGFEIVQV